MDREIRDVVKVLVLMFTATLIIGGFGEICIHYFGKTFGTMVLLLVLILIGTITLLLTKDEKTK